MERHSRSCSSSMLDKCWTTAILLLLTVGCMIRSTDACSCAMAHPQEHYCTSHYVISARVRNIRSDEFNNYYRIKINKVFKATEKASVVLADAKEISSPLSDAQCGVELERGKTYLLTGLVMNNKLSVSLCDFHSEWSTLSVKQKKGFKLLYEKGCNSCKVRVCPWWNRDRCGNPTPTQCAWDTVNERELDCQGKESVCMKQPAGKDGQAARCGWNRSVKFRHCLKLRKEKKERQRALEP